MAATAARKKIVVCGGTGFLGSRICRAAAARKWDVTSLSRSGTPTWSAITSSAEPPAWSAGVRWERADLLRPGSYAAHLEGADAVVHSMGILLEADYKAVVSGRESPLAALRRAFTSPAPARRRSANPLEADPVDSLRAEAGSGDGGQPNGQPNGQPAGSQLTYEAMNRDSAIALARESAARDVGTFVYISAAGGAPVLPARYIASKREAEAVVAEHLPALRSVFVRPGFMYDASRAFTVPLAYATLPGAALNWATGGRLSSLAGAAVEKPLKADVVADAVVEAIADDGVRGPVATEEIEALATRAWRRGML